MQSMMFLLNENQKKHKHPISGSTQATIEQIFAKHNHLNFVFQLIKTQLQNALNKSHKHQIPKLIYAIELMSYIVSKYVSNKNRCYEELYNFNKSLHLFCDTNLDDLPQHNSNNNEYNVQEIMEGFVELCETKPNKNSTQHNKTFIKLCVKYSDYVLNHVELKTIDSKEFAEFAQNCYTMIKKYVQFHIKHDKKDKHK